MKLKRSTVQYNTVKIKNEIEKKKNEIGMKYSTEQYSKKKNEIVKKYSTAQYSVSQPVTANCRTKNRN